MRSIARVVRHAGGLACAGLLVCAQVASAAGQSVVADFDGDGRRDSAMVDRAEPSTLHVWLSASRSEAIVRSRGPILRIVARDLDGDRRDELIAHGLGRLLVWTSRSTGFKRMRPRRGRSGAVVRPVGRRLGRKSGGPPVAVRPPTSSEGALAPAPEIRAPARDAAPVPSVRSAASHGGRLVAPLAPRPPPTAL